MSLLVDTNVLLRLAQPASANHDVARMALLNVANAGVTLCIVPQIVYEFWVAATRPAAVNGLAMTASTARHSLEELTSKCQFLKDDGGVFEHWQSLVHDYEVVGKNAHDARLVAAMQWHGLSDLLTFNSADFARFPMVRLWTPVDVAAGRIPS